MTSSPIRVLLIEDTPAEAAFVIECLTEYWAADFNITHANRFEKGIQFLQKGDFDVVLLDLNLPDSSGEQTIYNAREQAGDFPIVLFTSLNDEKMAQLALRHGIQDYLNKDSVNSELLVRSIRYAIDRHKTLKEVEESRERFALALRGANDGIWDWDLRTGDIYFSSRWYEILGFESLAFEPTPDAWFERVHPEDLAKLMAEFRPDVSSASKPFELELRIRNANDDYIWALTRGRAECDDDGKAYRFAGSISDISKRKRAEIQLRNDALHDSLTGLPNRTLLMEHLEKAIARSKRNGSYAFAVLFIDLDRFKVVNDSLGHISGDRLLVSVACQLQRLIRPEDIVARLGGDEFVIQLNNVTSNHQVLRVADRILESLKKPFVLQGIEVVVSASIGIAIGTSQYNNPEEIIRDADTAMYRAKNSGKSCHQLFDTIMHDVAMTRLTMESELRLAIDRNELFLHYQPIVTLDECKLKGFEALVRWNHGNKGMIWPMEFIPMAEETKLIIPLSEWVLRTACDQMADWMIKFPKTRDIYISVNLSTPQVEKPNFFEDVHGILLETGLAPDNLKLELTERMIMEPNEVIMQNLNGLKALGVELQIDDFGTGYSSLSYLSGFPFDHLKIDRAFVEGLSSGDKKSSDIIQSIASLADNLKMNVTAEGVETQGQREHLQSLNIKSAQGFLFAQPLASSEVAQWLTGSTKTPYF
jgi:diguanylate cyclase (GGDEF)-like protein/PAS domain S-box-containing protein